MGKVPINEVAAMTLEPKAVGLDYNDVTLLIQRAPRSEREQIKALREHVNFVITEDEARRWIRRVKP